MNAPEESARGARGFEVSPADVSRTCGACGEQARRSGARFCSTCGQELGREYSPADSLRASYRFEQPRETWGVAPRIERRRRVSRRVTSKSLRLEVIPGRNDNGASSSSLACVAYALVPYLGILFCPGALLFGSVGLVRSLRTPHAGGRRKAALGITLGVVIFCAQLVLWWILYKVPEWSRQASF